ncbi:MAG: aminotransferase class V-fold PLP-dependent enzyme [Spirochaetales bacterium]|nr:aminotransferase class V-fold PLP-dependent enzyme [Spirochaetales bacterium]
MKNTKESSIPWNEIASTYPVNKSYIWLNNAGSVPPGQHIINRMNDFINVYAHQSIMAPEFQFARLHGKVKDVLAGVAGCSSDDVALIHNTAEGINFISHGLRLEPGDEVLLLDREYPSNVYPWEHLQKKGIVLSFIPEALTVDGFLGNFKKSITSRTKVAALSAVHWLTGMPLPIKEISTLCRKRHIEVVLDISQGAGHVPLHLDEWGISFCAGSAWKWLQGPVGLGILIIKKEKINTLTYIFKGTSSVVSHHTYLPYKDTLIQTVDRYVYSTPSLIDWVYFDASLSFLSNLGFDAIRSRIFSLSGYLVDHLVALGFSVLNRRFEPCESGIVVAEHGGINSDEIVKKLKAFNIICAQREGRVRFSVHICNTFDQIDTLISVLKEII